MIEHKVTIKAFVGKDHVLSHVSKHTNLALTSLSSDGKVLTESMMPFKYSFGYSARTRFVLSALCGLCELCEHCRLCGLCRLRRLYFSSCDGTLAGARSTRASSRVIGT